MAIFRVERTKDYTVMSNYHLRDTNLSLKGKGLLSMMLSLPEDWNYTTRGLAKICKEGVDAISGALRELEAAGYIIRNRLRDKNGRISDTEYVIYEKPRHKKNKKKTTDKPNTDKPDTDSPCTENPYMVKPDTENPTQLNIEKSNKEKIKTDRLNTDSILFSETPAEQVQTPENEMKRNEVTSIEDFKIYREIILENIEYELLSSRFSDYQDDLDEIVELMVETVCAKRDTIRIASSNFPHEVVRSRFLKLTSEHIDFVMHCMRKNTTEVRNMKQYLLTVLFNAPTTMNNHFTAKVSHDMNGGNW